MQQQEPQLQTNTTIEPIVDVYVNHYNGLLPTISPSYELTIQTDRACFSIDFTEQQWEALKELINSGRYSNDY